ncbi:MAG: hypothetical protein LQ347_006746 [Umbilicaria vellea]|nr:MAG: hypothetical protein LQ347_006746 [Umbilicaria vellea]
MLLSSIILPLYIYPSGTPLTGTWAPLFSAISNNPSTNFTVIVSPNSGPGSSPYPDSNYIAHLAQLNTYSTVTTLGYVYASWADRNITDLEADISAYNKWASYSSADIHVEGVFIDEAPGAASTNTLSYMQQTASFVRSTFPMGHNTIITNPGVQVDSRFYAWADFLNVFENAYSAYTSTSITSTPKGYEGQATAIVHSFTGDAAAQQSIIDTVNNGNYGGLIVTTQDTYTAFSALWTQFCSAKTPASRKGKPGKGAPAGKRARRAVTERVTEISQDR